jgi:hypothetical protein
MLAFAIRWLFDLSVDLCRLLDFARLERLDSSRRQPVQIVLSALAGYRWFIRLKVSQFGR